MTLLLIGLMAGALVTLVWLAYSLHRLTAALLPALAVLRGAPPEPEPRAGWGPDPVPPPEPAWQPVADWLAHARDRGHSEVQLPEGDLLGRRPAEEE